MNTYKLHRPSLAARIGTGLGEGMAQQIPKEIENYRLSQGLRALAGRNDLTPQQQLAEFYGIPGTADRPELIRNWSEFIRREAKNRGAQQLLQQASANPSVTSNEPPQIDLKLNPAAQSNQGLLPTPETANNLRSKQATQAVLNPFVEPSAEQKRIEAAQLQKSNPALYPEIEDADRAVAEKYATQARQNAAAQQKRENEKGVTQDLVTDLQKRAGLEKNKRVPQDQYEKVLEEARKEVFDGKKSERDAENDAVKKVKEIDKEYAAVEQLGRWPLFSLNPKDVRRRLDSSQKKFAERDDQENLASNLVAHHGLSNNKAYEEAFKIKDYPKTYKQIKSLKPLTKVRTSGPLAGMEEKIGDPVAETLKVAPFLAKSMVEENASPLGISESLRKAGYSPDTWLNYLTENQKKIDMRARQSNELILERAEVPTLMDMFFSIFSGEE